MEGYLTLKEGAEAAGEFVDRKSRFIASLVRVGGEDDAARHLARVRAEHYDARHHVPAWILSDGTERASDDGEPQRTAGMPTLDVLRGAGLRDVSCVTTRYFGGVLLGPGGLVRAYAAAVTNAVEHARGQGLIVEMTPVTEVFVRVGYPLYELVGRLAAQAGGKVVASEFTDEVAVSFVFRAGEELPFIEAATERLAGGGSIEVGKTHVAEF